MPLLTIMTTFDLVSRQLAADLLLLLSQHSSICDQIRDVDGLPICLKYVNSYVLVSMYPPYAPIILMCEIQSKAGRVLYKVGIL